MSLTYLEVHLYFTIPATVVLWVLCRPFLSQRIRFQFLCLVTLALLYTTPWDSYLVQTGTWSYPEGRVLGSLGLIPLEEYFFFVIMTVMVGLWANLCLRWSLPQLQLGQASWTRALLIRWTPICPMVGASLWAWTKAVPNTPPFYFSTILWWILPVIALLWFGAGNYVLRRWRAVLGAVLVPSIYLCWVDLVALRDGVWVISQQATLGYFVYDVLPFEEAFFFGAVTVLIVFGVCGFEKAYAVLDMHPTLVKEETNILLKLWRGFVALESSLPQEPVKDLSLTLKVLKEASKSFWAAGFIFPPGARHHLSVLYAFCRVTDDMADNSGSKDQRRAKLEIVRKFLNQLFADREEKGSWTYGLKKKVSDPAMLPTIDWKYFEALLTQPELASFRALSTIAHYLPPQPFYELCSGYEWDLDQRPVTTQADLIQYSEYVASSVAVLCTYVLCHQGGASPNGLNETEHKGMIELARDMGVSLQLTNIARDIVTDSLTLGRCYVPEEWLKKSTELGLLTEAREPWKVGKGALQAYAVRILDLAEKYESGARKGFGMLPAEGVRPIMCATEIYGGIGRIIRANKEYVQRASLNGCGKLRIVLRWMYLPLGCLLRKK